MSAMTMKERIAAKRGDIAAGKAKGVRPYKFKNGKTQFRILPHPDQTSDWWTEFGQLYLKSFDGKDMVVIGDRYLTYGQEDPLRELVFDGMKHAQTEDIKDHFKEMLGGPRVLFNALVFNDKEQDPKTPVLIEISETQFDLILAQFQMYLDMDPNHDLSSLAKGHVFTCDREGTGKNDTKYTFLATPQPAPLNEAILEKAIDMKGWVEALFEAKEQKALGLLSKLGVNVGNASSVAAVLTAPGTGTQQQIGTTANVTGQAAAAVNPAVVTTVIDDAPVTPPVEDAVYADIPVDLAPTPPAQPQPAPVQEAAPAAEPAPAAASGASTTDIDAILASL